MRKSFTLIELLIVVAVIALLAMMVSGNYFTSLKRGRDAKRKSDLHAMQNALEQCFTVNNSTYPTITTSNGAKTVSETCPDASLSLSFTDPSTRTYTVVTSGTAYSISTTSEYDGSTISVSNLQ